MGWTLTRSQGQAPRADEPGGDSGIGFLGFWIDRVDFIFYETELAQNCTLWLLCRRHFHVLEKLLLRGLCLGW